MAASLERQREDHLYRHAAVVGGGDLGGGAREAVEEERDVVRQPGDVTHQGLQDRFLRHHQASCLRDGDASADRVVELGACPQHLAHVHVAEAVLALQPPGERPLAGSGRTQEDDGFVTPAARGHGAEDWRTDVVVR